MCMGWLYDRETIKPGKKGEEILEEYTKEELERKAKYDDMLQKYVRMIELGESEEEDDSNYIKRIAESMVSLGIAMCDFEKPEEATKDFMNFMMYLIHITIQEIMHQCYQQNPTGETSTGHFNKESLYRWRKDNGIK